MLCCDIDAAVTAAGELLSLSGAVSNLANVGEKVVDLGDCAFVRIPCKSEPVGCGVAFWDAAEGVTGWSVTSG